jgi:hypothetical protein
MSRGVTLVSVVALTLVLVLTTARMVAGQVPTATDMAGCNGHASDAMNTGAASPTVGDRDRAQSARGESTTANATEKVIESSDPQINGMEAEGAKMAAYQAAYRSCMRRNGF